ncbi:MAG: PorT family protein [Bacteroidales bacterium]|nr:PorT family protein [Bacteroidales bacterium]
MIKKPLLLLMLFAMLTATKSAWAQSFNAGLIAGATFSQVDGDRYYGFHKAGLTAGGYVNLPVSNHFAAQMELKYTQMGAHSSVKEVVEYGYHEYDLRLHYAEIPLMLNYDLGYFNINGKSLDFLTLEAGLSLDFLLKHRGEIDSSNALWKLNFFSVTGNFGLHFAFTDHWGLGARMMYSLTPMQTNPTPQYWLDHSYNKVIQFTLTYNINSPLR